MLTFIVKFSFALIILCFVDIYADLQDYPKTKITSMNNFVRYFTEEGAKHQVMILTDQNKKQSLEVNDIVQKITWCVPTLLVTLDKVENSLANSRHIGKNPRETTLFVIITFSNAANLTPNLEAQFALLSNLSHQYTRPKCLIVHFSNETNFQGIHFEAPYKSFLSQLWKRQFADVTVLRLEDVKLNVTNGLKISKTLSTLNQFNAYNKIYLSKNNWTISSWFPNKGSNLYNKNITVLFKDNDYKFLYGPVHETMAKCLNFKIQYIQLLYPFYIRLKPYNANIYLQGLQYYHYKQQANSHFSRILFLVDMKIAVPKIKIEFTINVLSWNLLMAIVGNLLFIKVLRILLLLMKAEKNCWQFLDIGGIILGMGLPNVPKSKRERFVLICLLLMCIIYSGFFHSMMTDMELRPVKYKEINSLKDLAATNLNLYTTVSHFLEKNDNEEVFLESLKNRTKPIIGGLKVHDCLKYLVTHKNVSCSVSSNAFLLSINHYKKLTHHKLEMKLIDETISYRGEAYLTNTGFVIMDNVNKKLLQFVEVGLMSKWKVYHSKVPAILSDELIDEGQSNKFLFRVMMLLMFGYFLAAVAFISEILWHYFTYKRGLRVIDLRKQRRQRFLLKFLRSRSKKTKRLRIQRKRKFTPIFENLRRRVHNLSV